MERFELNMSRLTVDTTLVIVHCQMFQDHGARYPIASDTAPEVTSRRRPQPAWASDHRVSRFVMDQVSK